MKRILFIILAIASLVSFSSCEGMLDEVNYGNPTIEEVMSDPANAVVLVGQAYADIKWLHDHWGYWGVASLTSDECFCPVRMPGKHWGDGGYWQPMNTHAWTENIEAFLNIWNTTISGAVGCNKIISILEPYKEDIGQETFDAFACELEVLRSYYYYLLFDCFGRIPYQESFDADTKQPLTETDEVWARLVNSLEKSAPKLPKVTDGNRAQYYGRVTQGFAYTLLARLYLNAPSFDVTIEGINKYLDDANKISDTKDFYTKAAAACVKVMQSGSYSIEENYFSNFKIFNEGSKENIFVIVEDGEDKDVRYSGSMSDRLRILSLTGHYELQKAWDLLEEPWNGFCARPSFLKRYNQNDVRGPGNEKNGTKNTKQWGWFVGPVYHGDEIASDENGQEVIITEEASIDNATWNDGARMLKYEYDKTGTYKWAENDFVLFRYADVLWMYEEAVINGAAGYATLRNEPDFRKMLARAFEYSGATEDECLAAFYAAYPESELFTTDGICDERGREFAWENIRRRDLLRFKKYNNQNYIDYLTKTEAYRKWFPIPFKVLEKSVVDENGNKLWTQNEGYLAQ